MSLIVQKFGGTSVANAEKIRAACVARFADDPRNDALEDARHEREFLVRPRDGGQDVAERAGQQQPGGRVRGLPGRADDVDRLTHRSRMTDPAPRSGQARWSAEKAGGPRSPAKITLTTI